MSANPVWLTLADIFPGEQVFLFENGCNWRDAVQGQLGNCWLIAALSSCGEFPNLVENLFETKTYTPGQPMKVRLFNRAANEWQTLSVKDRFPCDRATRKPCFAYPIGTEAWVMVLEKAFAKLFGSYKALEGGWQSVAWEILTGNTSSFYIKEDGAYRKYICGRPKDMGDLPLQRTREKFKELGDIYEMIGQADENRSLIGAIIATGADTQIDEFGLPGGHAYSVIAHSRGEDSTLDTALLLVRNPWGNDVEWNGKWSDNDTSSWEAHPELDQMTDHLQQSLNTPPGAWWMDISDFVTHYDIIMVCEQQPGMGTGSWAKPPQALGCAPNKELAKETVMHEDEGEDLPQLVQTLTLPPMVLKGEVLNYTAFGKLGFDGEDSEEDQAAGEAADAAANATTGTAYVNLTEVDVYVITKLFEQVDSDHDGFVTPEQLMAGAACSPDQETAVGAQGVAPWLLKLVDQGQSCITLADLLRINDELRDGLHLTIKSCDFGNFSVQGVFPSDTIQVLKEKIAAQRPGTPARLQYLLYGGLLLEDSHTVSEYGITDKAALTLVFVFV